MNSFFFLRKKSSFCVKLDFLYLLRFMKEKEMSFLQFAVTLQNAITWFWYIFIFWLLNLKKFNKNYHTKKKNQMYKNNKRNEQIEQAHRIFKKNTLEQNKNTVQTKTYGILFVQNKECLTRPLVGKSNWFPLTKSKINKWHPNRLYIVFTGTFMWIKPKTPIYRILHIRSKIHKFKITNSSFSLTQRIHTTAKNKLNLFDCIGKWSMNREFVET